MLNWEQDSSIISNPLAQSSNKIINLKVSRPSISDSNKVKAMKNTFMTKEDKESLLMMVNEDYKYFY